MNQKENQPLFSIVIPIYNAQKYLEQCLDSIVGQTNSDLEIILVDDGSSDSSWSICKKYEEKYKNIKAFHKENGGLVSTREKGMEESTGKYIGFVDADDWVERNLLEKVGSIIKKHDPDIISFQVVLEFQQKSEGRRLTVPEGYYDKQRLEKDIYPIMLFNKNENFYDFGIYPSISNKFVKRELLIKNRCKDYRITMGEDAACTYASFLEARSAYIMKEALYHYRQNPNSMTNQYDHERFEKYRILIEYLDQILGDRGYDLDQQLKAHKAFRVKHVILNESKASGNFREKKKYLKENMEKYHFDTAFDEIGDVKAGMATKVFIFLMRKRKYGWLLLMCETFKMIHKY